MNRLFPQLVFLCCLLIGGVVHAELRIVAATNDLAAIAKAVGGALVSVDVVARPDRDPHTVAVRPSTMRKTASAALYLAVGLDLDQWSAEIVSGSRNRDLRVIDCSQAVSAAEVPQGKVDASMGDIHPRGNPHYWLDPENGIAVAQLLAKEFATTQPQDTQTFQNNAVVFAADIQSRLPGWRSRLENVSFVEYHRSWVYLAARFSMHIVGQVEPLPGIPPTAKHLTQLAGTIQQTGAQVVVRDPFHSDSPLEFLQRETGIRSVVLPTMCDEPTADSYLQHFDQIAAALGHQAVEATGAEASK